MSEREQQLEQTLRELVEAIEKKADIGKFRQKTVSPLMEEVLERAIALLGPGRTHP
jgi:hypothetical protein